MKFFNSIWGSGQSRMFKFTAWVSAAGLFLGYSYFFEGQVPAPKGITHKKD